MAHDFTHLTKAFAAAGIDDPRLVRQMGFLFELEKLKSELRSTLTFADRDQRAVRNENVGEHSWHISVFALMLDEYARDKIDVMRAVKMLLIHDIIEIDSGDHDVYEVKDPEKLKLKESRGADRIFSLLPADQAAEYRALWQEFEDLKTPESQYAKAIDTLHPVLSNFLNGGAGWRQRNVPFSSVEALSAGKMREATPKLWAAVLACLEYGRGQNFFPKI